jgi:hypothetical protein
LAGRDDGLVIVKPILDLVGDVAKLLAPDPGDEEAFVRIRLAESTGRPLANADFIDGLERLLGRKIARRAPGRKPRPEPFSQDGLPFGK